MSENATATPIPVTIIPHSFDPWVYIVLTAVVFMVSIVLYYWIIKAPKSVTFKIYKKPDNTYLLRYYWSWYWYSSSAHQHYQNIETMEQKIQDILKNTEWKNQ